MNETKWISPVTATCVLKEWWGSNVERNQRMNLEDVMLSKIIQTHKDNYMVLPYETTIIVKYIQTENRTVITITGALEKEESLFKRYRVSFWNDESYWRCLLLVSSVLQFTNCILFL